MFDFKYHIVSLVAVFLALGIGVVMGSMTAERGVVTDQERALIATMEKDFERLRTENSEQAAQITADTLFAESAMPLMITDKLKDKNIAVVVTGGIGSPELKKLKAALETAGAKVTSVTTFTGGQGLDSKEAPKMLDEAARWIGNGANAKGVADMAAAGFLKTSGTYDIPVQGVVIIGGTENAKGPKFAALDAVIVKSFQNLSMVIIGGEISTVKNSAVQDFQNLGVSTVDNIDTTPGLVSLIYLLSGHPGDYGVKGTADSLMPPPVKS